MPKHPPHSQNLQDDDPSLEAMFGALRASSDVPPSPDFLARLVQDAEAEQSALPGAFAQSAPPKAVSFWQNLHTVFGGWPTFAGLASAAILGVWVGANPPDLLLAPTELLMGDTTDGLERLLMPFDEFEQAYLEG